MRFLRKKMTHACCLQHLLWYLFISKAVIQSCLWGRRRKTGAHCSMQTANFNSCFFTLSLYVCCGKNVFHVAHQQHATDSVQLF